MATMSAALESVARNASRVLSVMLRGRLGRDWPLNVHKITMIAMAVAVSVQGCATGMECFLRTDKDGKADQTKHHLPDPCLQEVPQVLGVIQAFVAAELIFHIQY